MDVLTRINKDYIIACLECIDECKRCISVCERMGGMEDCIKAYKACIAACNECINISSKSSLDKAICLQNCVEACEASIAESKKHSHRNCQEFAMKCGQFMDKFKNKLE